VQNVILGWLGRRAVEVGGLIGTVASIYFALPPERQDVVNRILSGEWQDITLGAIVPFGIYVFSQVLSFRATVKPQVVTPDGTKIALPKLDPSTRAKVQVDVANKKIDAKKADPLKPLFPNPLDWFLKRG
jgi:hypothetical protein